MALQTYLSEGDEVILLEPYFDIYKPSVRIAAGACARVVQLVPPADACSRDTEAGEWTLDIDSLKGAVHARTKAILLNTPHNPTGKVYTRHELEAIAKVAIDHDLLVISDEVYDELYYTSTRPVRIASLPGMWERTITVGSAGTKLAANPRFFRKEVWSDWVEDWMATGPPGAHRPGPCGALPDRVCRPIAPAGT